MCEFINNVPSAERWTVDPNAELVRKYADKNVKVVTGNATDAPTEYFDLVFVSNYLEHLDSQKDVAVFLSQMFEVVKAGGYICVMGPNFRVAWREYFDFADHTVCLTELGAAEHIIGAGFTLKKVIPRFLPLSFRGRLPANKILIQAYLNMPVAWRFFGKQFLIVGRK
jgi:SAM-dependent methyltransferase